MLPVASLASEIGQALSFAFGMLWEILWALILGFALSAMVQAVASKRTMTRLLPDARPRSLAVATGLGHEHAVPAPVTLGNLVVRTPGM
jgi:uncharacterized membrane protein YraQ (UPF0718 family)